MTHPVGQSKHLVWAVMQKDAKTKLKKGFSKSNANIKDLFSLHFHFLLFVLCLRVCVCVRLCKLPTANNINKSIMHGDEPIRITVQKIPISCFELVCVFLFWNQREGWNDKIMNKRKEWNSIYSYTLFSTNSIAFRLLWSHYAFAVYISNKNRIRQRMGICNATETSFPISFGTNRCFKNK